ncbi:hypothetical protein [Myxococcus xanthus]|uniref:hypothetical protein n=1 Tax=Myxococcus xanthus TaxID=34 RepID=UPI001128B687|nr:hypothetical protein [Myxococcus xanthus]
MKRSCILLLACTAIVTGCGHPSEGAPMEDPSEIQEELFEEIVAWLNSDGEVEQYTRFVTRAEREAQAATRLAQQQAAREGKAGFQVPSLIIDCNNTNSLWLFSGENHTGTKLCLYRNPAHGIAAIDLSRIVFLRFSGVTLYWNGMVRSLYAGADGGNLAHCDLARAICYSGNAPYVGFTPWEAVWSIASNTSLNTAWLSIY